MSSLTARPWAAVLVLALAPVVWFAFGDTALATMAADGPQREPLDFVYQGSFRVPHVDVLQVDGFGLDYGGTALAFNPLHNSLFMVGHDWKQLTTELAIPTELGTGTRLADWPTATVLQPLTDALEGHLFDVAANVGDKNTKIGGQFVYDGQLYLTTYVYYGAGEAHAFYRRSPSLTATGSLSAAMAVGPLAVDLYDGYMGLVPPEWRSALGGPVLIGNCCLSIISRTSYGPAVSSVDLGKLTSKAATDATALVYYPAQHPTLGNWGEPGVHPMFNGTTHITGVVFPAGTSSVLFFGKHGVGPFCYGEGAACNDPANAGKGDHAYPYAYQIWAYDAKDLALVKAGRKRPWDVLPYTVQSMHFPNNGNDNGVVGGAAYDPETHRIFVAQGFGDGVYPAIHVFTHH